METLIRSQHAQDARAGLTGGSYITMAKHNAIASAQVNGSQVSGFNSAQVFALTLSGLDFVAAFAGTSICDKLIVALRSSADRILGTPFKGAKAATLMVDTNTDKGVFAWPVEVSGDTYRRVHSDKTTKHFPVRGSVEALKVGYGAKNVRFVSIKELTALASKVKLDKQCALALGIEIKPKAAKAAK